MNRKVTVMDNPGMQMGSEVALSLGILAILNNYPYSFTHYFT
ncbi:hypothetical protein DMNBHIDG_00941 [Candidatus Methanoperedenaceae archaeon GB37]|nr:hypothetical protein DMNBHIDG_00941 [Candidatus Methanoperedenaceae archaeon GB37]